MKTTIKAMVLGAFVLFVGVMLRMQHATFADRATQGLLLSAAASSSPSELSAPPGGIRSSARALPAVPSSRVVDQFARVNVGTISPAGLFSPERPPTRLHAASRASTSTRSER